VLRGSRGDAAGTELGSSFAERTLHRWRWKDVRRAFTTPQGRWKPVTADGIELFNLSNPGTAPQADSTSARPRHLSGGRGRTGTTTLRSVADPGNFTEVDECCLTCGQAADVFSWLALSRAVVRTQCGPSRPGGTGLGRALNTGS
jgi:hypothetical protein